MLDLTAQQTYTRPLPTTTTHDHSKPCGPHAVPCARPIHDSWQSRIVNHHENYNFGIRTKVASGKCKNYHES